MINSSESNNKPDTDDYFWEWLELERREAALNTVLTITGLLFVLPFPAAIFIGSMWAVMYVFSDLLHITSQTIQIAVVILLWSAGYIAALAYRYSFRCPRCQKLFFVQKYGVLPTFSTKNCCVHCGINRPKPS